MKVKIKMNVPKPPTGMAGVTFFGHCYKWKNVFYEMGREYTVNKADFNPAIMVSLEVPKKGPTIIHLIAKEEKTEVDEEVELNTSDEVPFIVPENVEISTADEVPTETSKKRKHRKK